MTAPDLIDESWFTSSYSGSNGGNCVEVAFAEPVIGVRDSKDRTAGHLALRPTAWRALLTRLK
ncbi:DUF397 domain-containing protein [Amycolatopsis palatopharyngis]|uniref:DUF397 domain-containing protein n=1 Tax=Amycolatopsis palatopharyngis TaxID=187982 RepID=UPI000E25A568|nr:DUF397 domain-containing protein [Amycolatopsis palatopharyngis]